MAFRSPTAPPRQASRESVFLTRFSFSFFVFRKTPTSDKRDPIRWIPIMCIFDPFIERLAPIEGLRVLQFSIQSVSSTAAASWTVFKRSFTTFTPIFPSPVLLDRRLSSFACVPWEVFLNGSAVLPSFCFRPCGTPRKSNGH